MAASHDELPPGENYECPICRRSFHCAYCHRDEQLKERLNPWPWQPEGSLRFDKCPNCKEEDWLYCWEGDEPSCEACIDEAHARGHEAEDAMADALQGDDESCEFTDWSCMEC